ncbi:hypothetical protein DWX70_26520 [Bacteroides ovatus]|jgi:hypothetical protein|uniref:Uncharacterized protein n=2 Tax=Bacteroidales TaxID=171549 RepID=A0A395VUB9_BACOV|nr:hypothetical protein [Phocaeicola dorei]RGS77963.1 hypothetical protein DWX70_26520 [Bacteroides ovatus]
MAYEMVMPYHLHMPSYFLETFTEYPYRKHGCSEEFLFDWQLLINEVKAYQLESPATVKLPKLSPTETELVREEMTKR